MESSWPGDQFLFVFGGNVQYWKKYLKYQNQNFTIGTSSSFGSPVGSAIVLWMIFSHFKGHSLGRFQNCANTKIYHRYKNMSHLKVKRTARCFLLSPTTTTLLNTYIVATILVDDHKYKMVVPICFFRSWWSQEQNEPAVPLWWRPQSKLAQHFLLDFKKIKDFWSFFTLTWDPFER